MVMERCSKCGARVRSVLRHEGGPRCRVECLDKVLKARGLIRCGHHSRSLLKLGVRVEYHPTGYWSANAKEAAVQTNETWNAPWAPSWAVRICRFVDRIAKGTNMAGRRTKLRSELIFKAFCEASFRDSIESIIMLGGAVPQEWWDPRGEYAREDERLNVLKAIETEAALIASRRAAAAGS